MSNSRTIHVQQETNQRMKLYDALITHFFYRMKHKRKKHKKQDAESRKWIRWAIGGSLLVVLSLLFPRGQSSQFADMREGSVSSRRIVAPFSFEILKTADELQRDRELAVQKVYPVFTRDDKVFDETRNKTNRFFDDVVRYRKEVESRPRLKRAFTDSLFQKHRVNVLDTLNRQRILDNGTMTFTDIQNFQSILVTAIRDILSVGLLSTTKETFTSPDRKLVILTESEESVHDFKEFYDLNEMRLKLVEMLNNRTSSVFFKQMGYSIVSSFLEPNLIYDEALHASRINEARARVPLSSGFVYENEKIVDQNERITLEIRKKLTSLSVKMAEKGMSVRGFRLFLPFIGRLAFLSGLFFLFIVFIQQNSPEIFTDNKQVLLLAAVVLLVGAVTFLIHQLAVSEYMVPTAVGAMILAIVFGPWVGLASAAIMSVLVGALYGNEFNLMIFSFFVSVVGVLIIRSMNDRRRLVYSVFYMAGAYLFTITFLGLLRYLPFRDIIRDWPWGAAAGILAPVVTAGLLPLVEYLFDITTDFSLLELSSLNHPLLKRLSVQAPGTYHHSIIVGNLAESAAQTLGANPLLARVGSYYHDIGKVEKSEYFAENQIAGKNPHEKLTPRMSALILSNHVKKGIELSEKYKLPTAIKDIIMQHQGTTIMPIFYRKAKEKNESGEVHESDYRYPGPRPQTREAAIVMLADVVEAATRSLKAPTHNRLKNIIDELIDERFKEGQLDDSPLTLRDLEKIKESFLTILSGTFHTRVEYPDKDENKNNKTESDSTPVGRPESKPEADPRSAKNHSPTGKAGS